MDSYDQFSNFNVSMRGGKKSRDVEKSLYAIVNGALKLRSFNQRRITLNMYEGYLYRLKRSFIPETYVKDLAKKIIPDNEAYATKRAQAYRWYKNDFANELDKLYIILRDISIENA
jgi:hypothetical protein